MGGGGMDGSPVGLDRPMPAPGMGGAPAPAPAPMRPPMAAPPAMGGAGGMNGQPVMGAKRGGKIQEDAGAGSGLGRLEKTKEYGLKGSGEHENESFTEDGENKKMKRGGRS